MFQKHQTKISNAVMNDKSGKMLGKVMTMVILSIQQPWYRIEEMMLETNKKGIDSRYIGNWQMKRNAFKYILKNRKDIWQSMQDYKAGKIDLAELLLIVASCDGLGLVKAGFVIQLSIGEIGCLDVHNLRRFGLNGSTFKYGSNASYALMRKKAELYIETCNKLGGCEYLWDSWCEYLAEKNPNRFRDADHVSELHSNAMGL